MLAVPRIVLGALYALNTCLCLSFLLTSFDTGVISLLGEGGVGGTLRIVASDLELSVDKGWTLISVRKEERGSGMWSPVEWVWVGGKGDPQRRAEEDRSETGLKKSPRREGSFKRLNSQLPEMSCCLC